MVFNRQMALLIPQPRVNLPVQKAQVIGQNVKKHQATVVCLI
jgi:hypothetical protein